MSSYHPNQDPNLQQINVGNLPLYLEDEDELIESIARTSGDAYELENSVYSEESKLATSSLAVYVKDREDGQSWAYDGLMTYSPDIYIDPSRYFEILGNLVAEDREMSIEKAMFDTVYSIGSKAVKEVAFICHSDDASEVTYSNEEERYGTGHLDSLYLRIAPRIVTPERVSEQMHIQLKGYFFALNALSIAVDSHEVRHVSVITTTGSRAYARPADTHGETKNLPAIFEAAETDTTQEEELLMLDSLSGNARLKEQLEYVVASFKHPEVLKKWGAERPQGVLLYGPPGTGKTSFARAVANEIGAELQVIDSSRIYKKWLGESEENIKKIFKTARNTKDPLVLLFDEFESIISRSDDSSGGSRSLNSVSGIFKQEMNDLRSSNPNVLVFATTNHVDTIDESTVRAGRFDIKARVELPSEQVRADIFAVKIAHTITKLNTEDFIPFASDIDVHELATRIGDKSGADIVEVLRRATFEKAMQELRSGGTKSTPISQADLLKIITSIRQE